MKAYLQIVQILWLHKTYLSYYPQVAAANYYSSQELIKGNQTLTYVKHLKICP
jgi:hypothetical protein